MRRLPPRSTPKRRAPAGFTLMEVLLVLAILGVIIGLVLPNLLGQQKTANIKAANVQIHGIAEAAEFYALDHAGSYPTSVEELLFSPGNDATWNGPYLKNTTQVPLDPWGNPIQYQYPGNNSTDGSPDIWSMGPDRQNNTADDVSNWNKPM